MTRLERHACAVCAQIALALTIAAPRSAVAAGNAKVVVIPVAVGVSPDPDPTLVAGVADGLRQNARWSVEFGTRGRPLAMPPAALGADVLARTRTQLDDAARLLASAPSDALAAAESVWNELRTARAAGSLGADGEAQAFRAGALRVAAQLAAGKPDDAAPTALEVALLFPSRRPAANDGVPADAAERIAAAAVNPDPVKSTRIGFRSRPEGCAISVGGVVVGNAPVEIAALPDATYSVEATCGTGAMAGRSLPKPVVAGKAGEAHQELLDAAFARAFDNGAQGTRLRFSSPEERRQLEESYARRVAEVFGADSVVFLSVGELSGTDWLSGRLYLRSGYQNRVGLVRLELQRAVALGTYLATGKEMPGVLRSDEAYQLALASQNTAPTTNSSARRAWYTDVPGWVLTGVGAGGMVLGAMAASSANKKQDQADYADNVEKDAFKSQQLRKDSQNLKFLAGVGLVGGGLMAVTGIVLLITPEYTATRSELIGMTDGGRSGGDALTGFRVSLSGRF